MRLETTTGAACTRFAVNIAVPTAGTTVRTTARSCVAFSGSPQWTPAATNPFARGDAHTSTPCSRSPAVSRQAEREVRVLHGLSGRALAEVVERADDDRRAGRAVLEEPTSAASVPWTRASSGARPSGSTLTAWLSRVRRLERARRSPRRARSTSRSARAAPAAGAGRSRPGSRAPARSRARAVRADAVRRRRSRARRRRARLGFSDSPGAGHARLRVDHDDVRLDRAGERREREQRSGRIAARVGDQPALGRRAPAARTTSAEFARVRVLEAVPLRVVRRVCSRCAPERSTTTRAGRRLERGRALVVEAEEDDVRAARERLVVRHEAGSVAVAEARVERARAGCPASESEPSASSSSPGWASTRSSVSWPE